VPYGNDWYGYLVRRLAERPANLMFFLRALAAIGVTATDGAPRIENRLVENLSQDRSRRSPRPGRL
jgi:hypothetical protein